MLWESGQRFDWDAVCFKTTGIPGCPDTVVMLNTSQSRYTRNLQPCAKCLSEGYKDNLKNKLFIPELKIKFWRMQTEYKQATWLCPETILGFIKLFLFLYKWPLLWGAVFFPSRKWSLMMPKCLRVPSLLRPHQGQVGRTEVLSWSFSSWHLAFKLKF